MSLDLNSWNWPDELDGPSAAPDSHRILLDQGGVRVLEVIVRAGTREPEHTHRDPSVMIIDQPARLRYYAGGQSGVDVAPADDAEPSPRPSSSLPKVRMSRMVESQATRAGRKLGHLRVGVDFAGGF